MKNTLKLAAGATLLLAPVANAHSLDSGLSHSFFDGFVHPLYGLDHLLVLLAMGMISCQFRSANLTATGFQAIVLCVMGWGFTAGYLFGEISMMEAIILGSVFLAAVALWQITSQPLMGKALTLLCLAAVAVHGWAHGVEVGSASTVPFSIGMLLGSALIMCVGKSLTKLLSLPKLAAIIASAGAILSFVG